METESQVPDETETLALGASTETRLEGKGESAWNSVKVPDRGVVAFCSSPSLATLQIRSSGRTSATGTAHRRAYSVAVLGADEAARLGNWLLTWAVRNLKAKRSERYRDTP